MLAEEVGRFVLLLLGKECLRLDKIVRTLVVVGKSISVSTTYDRSVYFACGILQKKRDFFLCFLCFSKHTVITDPSVYLSLFRTSYFRIVSIPPSRSPDGRNKPSMKVV